MNQYPCKLIRVIDGDTFVLDVDVGFRMSFKDNFRLVNINTPEMNTPEGIEAKAKVIELIEELSEFGPMTVKSYKHGKYRWLGEIFFGAISLNEAIKHLKIG